MKRAGEVHWPVTALQLQKSGSRFDSCIVSLVGKLVESTASTTEVILLLMDDSTAQIKAHVPPDSLFLTAPLHPNAYYYVVGRPRTDKSKQVVIAVERLNLVEDFNQLTFHMLSVAVAEKRFVQTKPLGQYAIKAPATSAVQDEVISFLRTVAQTKEMGANAEEIVEQLGKKGSKPSKETVDGVIRALEADGTIFETIDSHFAITVMD